LAGRKRKGIHLERKRRGLRKALVKRRAWLNGRRKKGPERNYKALRGLKGKEDQKIYQEGWKN